MNSKLITFAVALSASSLLWAHGDEHHNSTEMPMGGHHMEGNMPHHMQDGEPGHRGDNMGEMRGKNKLQNQVVTATGTVNKVWEKKQRVMIKHDPIAELNWPTMKMMFNVDESVEMSKFKKGQTIQFDLMVNGDEYTIVDVE